MSDFLGFKSLGRGLYRHTKRSFEPMGWAGDVIKETIDANFSVNKVEPVFDNVPLSKMRRNALVGAIANTICCVICGLASAYHSQVGGINLFSAFGCLVVSAGTAYFAVTDYNAYFKMQEMQD